MKASRIGLLLGVLALAGCWNGENMNVRLGDVSLGQQLIDLQRSLEAGAIDDAEYAELRATLMATADLCGELEED